MVEMVRKDKIAKFVILLFAFFVLWWAYLHLALPKENIQYQIFGATYGILALFGGIWGLHTSLGWGGMKSLMGKAIIMFSLGLLMQEFGQIVYSVYTFVLKVEIPYPSLGDVGYFGSIPFYAYGIYLLGKVAGVKYGIKSTLSKVQAVVLPAVLLITSYIIFLKEYKFDWSQPLTIFLDFGYPLAQAFYLSLALLAYLLSRKLLGGMMKNKILFIIGALLVQYFADFMFLYQAHNNTAYAGGDNDLLYLIAYFVMVMGILQLRTVMRSLRSS